MTQVIRPFYVTLGNSGRRDLTVCEGEVRYTLEDYSEVAVRFHPESEWVPVSGIAMDLLDLQLKYSDLRAMAEADREAAEFAAPVTIVTDPEGFDTRNDPFSGVEGVA